MWLASAPEEQPTSNYTSRKSSTGTTCGWFLLTGNWSPPTLQSQSHQPFSPSSCIIGFRWESTWLNTTPICTLTFVLHDPQMSLKTRDTCWGVHVDQLGNKRWSRLLSPRNVKLNTDPILVKILIEALLLLASKISFPNYYLWWAVSSSDGLPGAHWKMGAPLL
jgi:hypothetical protein